MEKILLLKPLLAAALALALAGCRGPLATTQTVREVKVDTVYLHSEHFDSVYIAHDRAVEMVRDTVYVKEVATEYRYRRLRDTVRSVVRDSIPYQVTVTHVKEIQRPLTAFDYLCRAALALVILYLIYHGLRLYLRSGLGI